MHPVNVSSPFPHRVPLGQTHMMKCFRKLSLDYIIVLEVAKVRV